MRRTKTLAALALTLLVAGSALAADSPLWLHVRVEEAGSDAKVVVNLPFSLIDKALPMIDIGDHIRDDTIHLNGHRLSYEEMRELWLEVRQGPDMAFVTVEERDESVRIWKEGGYFHVRVRDRGDERVDIRMPLRVMDALMSAERDFDVSAAVAALADHGEGELVSVHEDDESVRVWVDRNPEATD